MVFSLYCGYILEEKITIYSTLFIFFDGKKILIRMKKICENQKDKESFGQGYNFYISRKSLVL